MFYYFVPFFFDDSSTIQSFLVCGGAKSHSVHHYVADGLLTVGSSLVVYYAFWHVLVGCQQGIPVTILNDE
jgi:hypothetical protein